MNRVEPENVNDLYSSYRRKNLGRTLYDLVMMIEPRRIVEFGVLQGYSTVCMALALKRLGKGVLKGYDLWERYPYRHETMEVATASLERYGVSGYVELGRMDFYEWVKAPEPFDLLHVDISNDGDTVRLLADKLAPAIDAGAIVVFEGGTEERDHVDWMVRYNRTSMVSVQKETGYTVLNPAFPALSILRKRT